MLRGGELVFYFSNVFIEFFGGIIMDNYRLGRSEGVGGYQGYNPSRAALGGGSRNFLPQDRSLSRSEIEQMLLSLRAYDKNEGRIPYDQPGEKDSKYEIGATRSSMYELGSVPLAGGAGNLSGGLGYS